MVPYISLIVVLQILFLGLSSAEDVIKCLKMPKEKLRISCPKNHVIYNPKIVAGSGSSCQPSPDDCLTTPRYLKQQTNKCFWKKRCTIKLTSRLTTSYCNNRPEDAAHNITYIVIKQMYCVPKDLIIDMCKKPRKGYSFNIGIIRSHKGYPRHRPKSMTCKMDIPIGKSRTLVLETKTEIRTLPEGLTLQKVGTDGLSYFNISVNDEIIINGNTSETLRVITNYHRKRGRYSGFIIPFIAYKTKVLQAFLGWPDRSRPVMKELGWIREVRPVIEQCAVNVDGHMKLVCNNDEVIYSPAVSLSGYTRRKSKCIFSDHYPCGGYTPELLVQRNLCYWKNSCDITWNGADRIVVSKVNKCIGYSVSSLGLSGHRCIRKDNIRDLCTNCTEVINASWGIIRSHPLYPWYFDSGFAECKRIIHIGKQFALLLIVQDINLDPDGRDKFAVVHTRKYTQKEVLNSKSGQEGAHVVVRGGKIVIKFKPFKTSKGGRGFILVFRRFLVTKQEFGIPGTFYPNMADTDTMALQDSASTLISTRLSNWRLCSKPKRRKDRGRTCNSRVWTDYFTRLE